MRSATRFRRSGTKDLDDKGSLSLKGVLSKLVSLLQTVAGNRRIQIETIDARLLFDQASALSLIVNELVVNAIKHGQGGVSLSVVQESNVQGQESMRLEIFDDGPGFPEGFDPVLSANHGIELFESLGRRDLKGQTYYTNRPAGGACVGLVFPLR